MFCLVAVFESNTRYAVSASPLLPRLPTIVRSASPVRPCIRRFEDGAFQGGTIVRSASPAPPCIRRFEDGDCQGGGTRHEGGEQGHEAGEGRALGWDGVREQCGRSQVLAQRGGHGAGVRAEDTTCAVMDAGLGWGGRVLIVLRFSLSVEDTGLGCGHRRRRHGCRVPHGGREGPPPSFEQALSRR